jgi:hypothetical protein
VLYCFPKAYYADIKVGFSISQRKIRFQLFRLEFPDTKEAIKYLLQFTALFPVPNGYEIVGIHIGEEWKVVELKLVVPPTLIEHNQFMFMGCPVQTEK